MNVRDHAGVAKRHAVGIITCCVTETVMRRPLNVPALVCKRQNDGAAGATSSSAAMLRVATSVRRSMSSADAGPY